MLRVSEIMTPKVITLDVRASRGEAESALTRQKIGGAPVIDAEGQLVGMLSKSDLVSHDLDWLKGEGTVGDLMMPDILSVYDDQPARLACELMAERKVHRLVVVNVEGQIVGIVSTMDVVKAAAHGARFDLDS